MSVKIKQETIEELISYYFKQPKRKLAEIAANNQAHIRQLIRERNELQKLLETKNSLDKLLNEQAKSFNELTAIQAQQHKTACDTCGCHPNSLFTTPFGTFCQEHARFV